MKQKARLYIVPEPDGAGACCLNYFSNQGDAVEFEDNMEEGWGDGVLTSIDLVIHEGMICLEQYDWDAPRVECPDTGKLTIAKKYIPLQIING